MSPKELYNQLTKEEKHLLSSIRWLHLFSANGWNWITGFENETDGYNNYQMTLLSDMYDCTITAFVSTDLEGISNGGDIGISWLECAYEYNRDNYSMCDLKDMIQGIRLAEKNLVKLGIPFENDYTFHQITKQENYNLKRANIKNRKKLKCDEIANLWNIACDRLKELEK